MRWLAVNALVGCDEMGQRMRPCPLALDGAVSMLEDGAQLDVIGARADARERVTNLPFVGATITAKQ